MTRSEILTAAAQHLSLVKEHKDWYFMLDMEDEWTVAYAKAKAEYTVAYRQYTNPFNEQKVAY